MCGAGVSALPGKAVGKGITGDKAEKAADEGSEDIAAGGEVLAGTQEHGVFKRKGGQGGITAAEAGGERQAEVGGFDEACRGQTAEKPHEEAATEIDEEGVPWHVCGRDSPTGADEIGGEVTQHATYKTTATHKEQSFER